MLNGGAVTPVPCSFVRPSGSRVLAAGLLGLAGLGMVSACAGDPAPPPKTAPLEVVLADCALNRPSVAPGQHALAVVGPGRVTVSDPAGNVVLTARGEEGTPADLQITARGTYDLTCEPEGGRLGEARLEVGTTG